MTNSASKISDYKFSQDDRLLLDANVWLYLLPGPSSALGYATKVYSAAFKAMLNAQSSIVVNALILSEYLNRYCRIEWQARFRQNQPDFKAFRQSAEYLAVGQSAAAFARTIVKHAKKADDGFTGADLKAVLTTFENGSSDFNDGMLIDACSRNDWTLVTHDGDFTNGGINLLTENNRLLASCGPKKVELVEGKPIGGTQVARPA